MNRLIGFGCSYTYGTGLKDRNNSWPNQLATKWKLGAVNMGVGGASFKRIWWEIMQFNFRPEDTVAILWTHLDRFCILQDTHRTGPNASGDHIEWDIYQKPTIRIYKGYKTDSDFLLQRKKEAYYKYIHDDFDYLAHYLALINHTYFYLKDKVKAQYHMRVDYRDAVLPFNEVDYLPIDFCAIRDLHKKSHDGVHPEKEGYAEFVKQIDRCVNNKDNNG